MQNKFPTGARSTSIVHPYFDFWLLGGASVFLWAVTSIAQFGRFQSLAIEMRFSQIGMAFAALTLFCNHPHFMISYRFGYGRGWRFILKNWFALIAVPVFLVGLFAIAFFYFDADVSESKAVAALNDCFEFLHIEYRFGTGSHFGDELLGASLWLMYFTVGWHYAKQVFGCMMVYAFYGKYDLTLTQKRLLKWSIFSVAFLQFTTLYTSSANYPANQMMSQTGFGMTPLGLPPLLKTIASIATFVLFLAVLGMVFWQNYRLKKALPPTNFLVPWVAIYIWWTPLFFPPELVYLTVPFFHSLQYLPFAWRMEEPSIGHSQWYYFNLTVRLTVLLLIGFLAFEMVPNSLDTWFESSQLRTAGFFVTAFAVFINVHHFFIDSVVWKFNQPEVRERILDPRSQDVAGHPSPMISDISYAVPKTDAAG